MSFITDIYDRIIAKIPVRGTLVTPTGSEDYPTALCNEVMGGPFIMGTLDQMKEIPVERLIKGCKCTVNEHVTPGGVTEKTTTYMLLAVPSEKLSAIPGVNISDYWILDAPIQSGEDEVQSQYSPNYEGKKPNFLAPTITTEAYNAGYGSTADFESGDTSLKIWADNYDDTIHIWVRQRTSQQADWGVPIKVDDGYESGSYNDVRFQWKLTVEGAPARPSSMVNGVANNNPSGWNDTPDIPQGEDYNTYILTNSLWKISGIKDAYGNLLSEWTTPVQISTDPNLVRYGVDASNNDYLNDTYWRPYYSTGDRFRASRPSVNLPWTVERISGESGEYIDYVFKEYIDSYEPVPTDAPTSQLGFGIDGWQDGVFKAQDGYTLYVSTSRKFSDGTISENWTTPVRYDGKNTIRTVVIAKNNVGQTFKYKQVDGESVHTPTSITLKAQLFDANKEITSDNFTSVQWYRGTVEDGTLIPILPIGTEPNRNPQYGGTNNSELTIFPENVSGTQTFSARVVFNGEDYRDPINIVDVTDGVGYQTIIESETGFIYKGTEIKTFNAYLYENGELVTSNVTYNWRFKGNSIGTGQTVQIADTKVSGISDLSLSCTLNGTTYKRIEALTDISDGNSLERQYSSMEVIDINDTPDTPGNPSGWSTDSTGAVWVIERLEGAQSWNVPYRVLGEKGNPSGAFQMTVYRTRLDGTTPAWLTEKPVAKTGIGEVLIPDDWAATPENSAPTGSEIYGTKATFIKSPDNEDTAETTDNWTITAAGWSMPFKQTHFPPAGTNGDPGTDGTNGWSPEFAIEEDGDRRVQKLIQWVGGTGAKPPNEGYYVGSSGLVATAAQAVDIRGTIGIKGDDGVFDPSTDYWLGDWEIASYSGGTGTEARFFTRMTKTGTVHYRLEVYKPPGTGSGDFTIGQFGGDPGDLPLDHLPSTPVINNTSNYRHSIPVRSTSGHATSLRIDKGFKDIIFGGSENNYYFSQGSWVTNSAL